MSNYRNQKLTQSAKHENCVSCGSLDSVWCHSNEYYHGKGKGTKAHDVFGFYGCQKCHDWYDGRAKLEPPSYSSYDNKFAWFREMWERSIITASERGSL